MSKFSIIKKYAHLQDYLWLLLPYFGWFYFCAKIRYRLRISTSEAEKMLFRAELTKEEIEELRISDTIRQVLYTEQGRMSLANAIVKPMRRKLEYSAVGRKQYV